MVADRFPAVVLTCQKVVDHPFVHVSMTGPLLFFHVEGSGGGVPTLLHSPAVTSPPQGDGGGSPIGQDARHLCQHTPFFTCG